MPAGKTSKKRKKDLFSSGNIKKVDKKLLTAALVKSRQPTGKIKEDVKRKTKKDVDNTKNAKFIGKTLRRHAQLRKGKKSWKL